MGIMILLALIFYALGLAWLLRATYSYVQIKRARSTEGLLGRSTHVDILLPVLEENDRLVSFVSYFKDVIKPNYATFTIWIITTEQESVGSDRPITWQVANELAFAYSFVRRVHYPKAGGVMAHQLNYALARIRSRGLFAVYNADSRPEPQTFRWVNREFSRLNLDKVIFQQYGNYLKNHREIARKKWHNLLLANGNPFGSLFSSRLVCVCI